MKKKKEKQQQMWWYKYQFRVSENSSGCCCCRCGYCQSYGSVVCLCFPSPWSAGPIEPVREPLSLCVSSSLRRPSHPSRCVSTSRTQQHSIRSSYLEKGKKKGINRTIYLAFFLPFRFFSDAVVVSSTTKKVAGGVTPQSSPADCKHSLKQDRTYVRIIRNLFQKGERKRERLLKVASVFRWSVLLLLRPCGGIQKTAQKDTTEDSAVDVFDVSQ